MQRDRIVWQAVWSQDVRMAAEGGPSVAEHATIGSFLGTSSVTSQICENRENQFFKLSKF
jgi:hypothetical protein